MPMFRDLVIDTSNSCYHVDEKYVFAAVVARCEYCNALQVRFAAPAASA